MHEVACIVTYLMHMVENVPQVGNVRNDDLVDWDLGEIWVQFLAVPKTSHATISVTHFPSCKVRIVLPLSA